MAPKQLAIARQEEADLQIIDQRDPLFARVDFPFLDDRRIRVVNHWRGKRLKGASVVAGYNGLARFANFTEFPAQGKMPAGRSGWARRSKIAAVARIKIETLDRVLDFLEWLGWIHRGPHRLGLPRIVVLCRAPRKRLGEVTPLGGYPPKGIHPRSEDLEREKDGFRSAHVDKRGHRIGART